MFGFTVVIQHFLPDTFHFLTEPGFKRISPYNNSKISPVIVFFQSGLNPKNNKATTNVD